MSLPAVLAQVPCLFALAIDQKKTTGGNSTTDIKVLHVKRAPLKSDSVIGGIAPVHE